MASLTRCDRGARRNRWCRLSGVPPPDQRRIDIDCGVRGPLPADREHAGSDHQPRSVRPHLSPVVDSPLADAVSLFFANGGTVARVVRIGSGAPDDEVSMPGLEPLGQGLWALRDTTFDLLCVPPYTAWRDGDVSARTAAGGGSALPRTSGDIRRPIRLRPGPVGTMLSPGSEAPSGDYRQTRT